MPDTNNNSDPAPSNSEEIKSLKELDREIAAAKALPVIPTAFEARLTSVRSASPNVQPANVVPPGAEIPPGEPPADNPASANQNGMKPGSLNPGAIATPPAPTPASSTLPTGNAPHPPEVSPSPDSGGLFLPPSIFDNTGPVTSIPDLVTGFSSLPPDATTPHGARTSPAIDADALSAFDSSSAGASAAQAQTLQQSADRLRNALEQNTGLANS